MIFETIQRHHLGGWEILMASFHYLFTFQHMIDGLMNKMNFRVCLVNISFIAKSKRPDLFFVWRGRRWIGWSLSQRTALKQMVAWLTRKLPAPRSTPTSLIPFWCSILLFSSMDSILVAVIRAAPGWEASTISRIEENRLHWAFFSVTKTLQDRQASRSVLKQGSSLRQCING